MHGTLYSKTGKKKVKFGPALKSAMLSLFDYCTILQCLNLVISRNMRDYYFSLISLNQHAQLVYNARSYGYIRCIFSEQPTVNGYSLPKTN